MIVTTLVVARETPFYGGNSMTRAPAAAGKRAALPAGYAGVHGGIVGQYLAEPHAGQFTRLPAWLSLHRDALLRVLRPELMLFGEWCAARHSLDYSALPD